MIIPIFIPHVGCPHQCVFCNQNSIAGLHDIPTKEMIYRQVTEYRATMKEPKKVQLAFYGGSFTSIAPELRLNLLSIAKNLKTQGLIDIIRLSTRPDDMGVEIIEELKEYSVDIVELGVQSMDNEVLLASGRGHTAQDAIEAADRIKRANIKLGLQMMIALPNDTPEKTLETTKKVINCMPDFVRIYPTAVIKDTKLAQLWKDGIYQPWAWDVLLDTTAEVLRLFEQANIPVIRIGLQAAENLSYDQDLLAGAYHPAMGELVKSRLMRMKLEELLQQKGTANKSWIVLCNKNQLSQIRGQKNQNITYFKNKGYQLNIIPKIDIPWGTLVLNEGEPNCI